jgi:hypothetical protein
MAGGWHSAGVRLFSIFDFLTRYKVQMILTASCIARRESAAAEILPMDMQYEQLYRGERMNVFFAEAGDSRV